MSRIGKKAITADNGVKVQLNGEQISIEGPKGKLVKQLHARVKVKVDKERIEVIGDDSDRTGKALHGLTRSLIQNMIFGVTQGFSKSLMIEGVGFKAQLNGKTLQLSLGFSHPINYAIPDGIQVDTPKPTQLTIKGIDKALVGQVAADIRHFFEPEPYKGKGVRYIDELVRKKKGKAVQ